MASVMGIEHPRLQAHRLVAVSDSNRGPPKIVDIRTKDIEGMIVMPKDNRQDGKSALDVLCISGKTCA